MTFIKFLVSAIVSLILIFFLGNRISVGDKKLPAPGKFLNPSTGFWKNADPGVYAPPKTVKLEGISEEVKIVYDDRLVPHIFAANARDASYAQGYVTASHRLWQMEFYTLAAAGRLSEILGKRLLKRDMQNRNLGIPFAAKNAIGEWKKYPDHFELLEAYADGVNDYISSLRKSDYPIEYKLIGHEPAEWSTYRIALLQKMMAQTLAMREDDLESSNARAILGEEEFNFVFPEWYEEQSPIVPKGTAWAEPGEKVNTPVKNGKEDSKVLSRRSYPKPPPHLGSNNWALSGGKTKSGNPILCNDPHLNLSLPSIWYEVQVTIPDHNVYGVCLPGSPGVIIGFNDHVAWGMTNVGHDVSDWVTVQWKDDTRSEYLYEGEYRKSTYEVQEYKVRGGETVTDTLFFTHWGPVAYKEPGTVKNDMAFQWLAHRPSNEMSPFFHLNRAKNYDDYKNAISEYSCPAQNFVFASKEGDIAIWVQGRFPLKDDQQGRFVQDGSLASSEWQGYIPREENPHYKNPERLFVSSANQHSTDPSYPYYYNGGFADYRGRIINEKLSKMNDVSVQDLMTLQNDNFNLRAKEFLDSALELVDKSVLDKDELGFYNEVSNWDFVNDKAKVAPSIFDAWFDEFYRQTWDEFYVLNDSLEILFPEYWRTIYLLRDTPENEWFDKASSDTKESAADIATLSFKSAAGKLKSWIEDNNKTPVWRDYKNSSINHLLRIKAFSINNLDIGGDKYAINAMGKTHGPSWRMVIELGEEITGYGVYPGGQSGNPGSKYYSNSVDKWAKGEYHNLLKLKSSDEESDRIIASQTLSPK